MLGCDPSLWPDTLDTWWLAVTLVLTALWFWLYMLGCDPFPVASCLIVTLLWLTMFGSVWPICDFVVTWLWKQTDTFPWLVFAWLWSRLSLTHLWSYGCDYWRWSSCDLSVTACCDPVTDSDPAVCPALAKQPHHAIGSVCIVYKQANVSYSVLEHSL